MALANTPMLEILSMKENGAMAGKKVGENSVLLGIISKENGMKEKFMGSISGQEGIVMKEDL